MSVRALPVPVVRPRRLRSTAALRAMMRETTLNVADFIYPMFALAEKGPIRREIGSMPGVFQYSIDDLRGAVDDIVDAGILSIILFGLPEAKDEQASEAFAERGVVQRAVRAIKSDHPELVVITDVCVDEYTSHGHCGIVRGGEVVNDETLDLLARVALSHVDAGADVVAPSDMMDGRVAAIRTALDDNGYTNTPILSYAVKYASAMYGPFREAADSSPKFGDRRSYQMDFANRREAVKEVDLDIAEGADMIMVKPALAYLDIVRDVRERVNVPVAAYNVSGEYAMVKAAARNGWIDERATVLEILTGIKRAGADLILTYHALDAAGWLGS